MKFETTVFNGKRIQISYIVGYIGGNKCQLIRKEVFDGHEDFIHIANLDSAEVTDFLLNEVDRFSYSTEAEMIEEATVKF